MSIEIFANHAHVFPQAVNPNGTIDRLLNMLDACGIARAVCFAPFGMQMDGQSEKPNPWLANELLSRERLIGFGTIDFRRRDVKGQVREAAELGFRGLKLHPNIQKFDVLCAKA